MARTLLTIALLGLAAGMPAPALAQESDGSGLYEPFPEPASAEDLGPAGIPAATGVDAARQAFRERLRKTAGGGQATARAAAAPSDGGSLPVAGLSVLVVVALCCHWLVRRRRAAPDPVSG